MPVEHALPRQEESLVGANNMAINEETRILVVDDMPDKLMSIRVVLEELKQQIVCVSSGREALRALLEHEFAVVLLDVNMPEMDGFETASLIRKRKRSEHVPIIFLTAYDDEQRRWQSYSLGAVDFIPTPVIPEVLRAKVAVFVDLFRKTEQIKRQAVQEVILAREHAARTAAEKSNRHLSFLAKASNDLGQSLDFDATIETLLHLPVPLLCDATLLILAGALSNERHVDYGATLLSSESLDSQCEPQHTWHRQHCSLDSLSDSFRSIVEEVFSGREKSQIYHGPTFVDDEADLGAFSQNVLMPLVARGRTFGVLCLKNVRQEQGQQEDLVLAHELAVRGGIALDNARLHREIQVGNQRKDEFLAMLGHELRNPLAAISNALSVMELMDGDSSGREYPDEIQSVLNRQVKQMNRLIDDLLDVSRITSGKVQLRKEVIDLRTVLERAVATCRSFVKERQQHLHVDVEGEPLLVFADAARMEQVITNLLTNAAKYSEPASEIWLFAGKEDCNVQIDVRDTGLGIPADLLHKIFDLFVQGERSLDRSQGGLGIGLTLVRSLVELHGGRVSVASGGPRKGSHFSISLPALTKTTTADSTANTCLQDRAESSSLTCSHDTSKRILVIEDNVDVAATFEQLLRSVGYEVHVAHDGMKGLADAKRLVPDIIFVDIGLPAMDGLAIARDLRSSPLFQKITLVALTGYGQPDDRRRTLEAGFNHHLIKPVPMEELNKLLDLLDATEQIVVD